MQKVEKNNKLADMKQKSKFRFLTLIVIMLSITTSCNGQKMLNNNKNDTIMRQELPENALCVLNENKDGLTYLTSVRLLSEYEQQYVRFIGNGDYFLSYDTEYKSKERNIGDNRRYTIHIIPEKNDRFRLEARMESRTFYENGKNVGHAEPSGEWIFVGYSDDKDNEVVKILQYFNEHKKK